MGVVVAPSTTFQLDGVTFEEEYTVTVTPSNTLGLGLPASATFCEFNYMYIYLHHAMFVLLTCISV